MRKLLVLVTLLTSALLSTGCDETPAPDQDAELTREEARSQARAEALGESDLYSFDDPPPTWDDDCDVVLNAGDDVNGDSAMLNAAVEGAKSWDVICLSPGVYTMNRAVTVSAVANLTVKGIGAAPEDVVLDYAGQSDEKGFFVTTPGFWIENMWIRNTKGNGVEVKATNSLETPNVFRKLRVDWEGISSVDNGAYSVYPTRSAWVVVEFCEVHGASDAGLYIGQVVHGIIRHNYVHGNVAGLEVENSEEVVVYENFVEDNAGGILALQEPGLTRLANRNVLIRDNLVIGNNHENFAVPGSTVSSIPPGTGLMSFSGNGIEFRNNVVAENDTVGLLIVSNIVLEVIAGGDPNRPWPDRYDPLPQNIYANANYFYDNGEEPDVLVWTLIQQLDNTATLPLEDVLYDGGLPPSDPGDRRICVGTKTPTSIRVLLIYSASTECDLDPVAFTPFATGYEEPEPGGTGPTGPPPVNGSSIPATLAGWNLFEDAPAQTPAENVHPFDVTAPLFTDYALKHRFLYVPPGKQISYSDDEQKWDFPEGSILVKTFAFPVDERSPSLGEQLIETRLLVHEASGWQPYVYAWNSAGTRASRVIHGPIKSVSWIDMAGDTQTVESYAIPTQAECRTCHGTAPDTRPLGPSTAMLDRDNDFGGGPENQVDYYHGKGLFDRAPLPRAQRLQFPDPFDVAADATDRARAYLHTNCSHCHAADGLQSEKNLFVEWSRTDPITGDPADLKVGLPATSAGNADCLADTGGIVITAGDPVASLLLCRMEIASPEPGMMPPLGRSVVHEAAVNLIADWITNMSVPE